MRSFSLIAEDFCEVRRSLEIVREEVTLEPAREESGKLVIRDRKKSLIVIFCCCVMVASLAVFIGIGMARKDRTNPASHKITKTMYFYKDTVNLTENVAEPEPQEDKGQLEGKSLKRSPGT